MKLAQFDQWIAWAGVVLPLAALAWSALWFVSIEGRKAKNARYDQFFELMEQIGRQDHSIAAKMAAAYALRRFPEYREVIIRVLTESKIDGGAATMLAREFHLTAKHLGGEGRVEFEGKE